MALVKCSECKHEISKKAKMCPNCGGKNKKRTSGLTWLVLVGIVGAAAQNGTTTTKPNVSTKSSTVLTTASTVSYKKTPVAAAAKPPQWKSWETSDDMTGQKQAYAQSPTITSTRRMSFPYTGVTTKVMVGCDANSEWAYFHFTKPPNLNNTDIGDGYHTVRTRIKWGETLSAVRLTQTWGDKFLHFSNDEDAIYSLARKNEMRLELQWHGQSKVYFDYPLNGSSDAIKRMREKCKSY